MKEREKERGEIFRSKRTFSEERRTCDVRTNCEPYDQSRRDSGYISHDYISAFSLSLSISHLFSFSLSLFLSLSLSLSHFFFSLSKSLFLPLMSNDSCNEHKGILSLERKSERIERESEKNRKRGREKNRKRKRERKEENERGQITRPEKGRKIVGIL